MERCLICRSYHVVKVGPDEFGCLKCGFIRANYPDAVIGYGCFWGGKRWWGEEGHTVGGVT